MPKRPKPPQLPKPDEALIAKTSSRVQADNNSVAVGSITIGSSIAGSVVIGNDNVVGYTSEQVSTLIKQISSTFQPKLFDGRCPYKGLDFFEEEDSELFFGREKLVEDLVSRVKDSRTVFVTGPSGSGKSSLVRAGLIHSLKQGAIKETNSDRWLYATMRPGRDPFEALAGVFSRLKSPELGNYFRQNISKPDVLHECVESALGEREEQRLVLFIDQFEEVFTQLSGDKAGAFIDLLANAGTIESGRVILLFAMRSDFVSNCATYPKLNALLNQQFLQIGAMQSDELVSAIAQPALRVGLRIDPDLIAQIINDMQGEPGALPLMQFALKDLFDSQQAQGGVIALTLNGYLERGGISKALERYADDSFNKLDGREQELARSIFSGLIEIGRGTQDTRRTAIFDELIPASAKADEVQAIVRRLADARLITTDEVAGKDTVTISHEKLIDAWPWLKKLVNENRDVIALQNEIAEDAQEWEEHKRDASYLYTGGRLINTQEKLAARKLVLSGKALEFVNTGIKRRSRLRFSLMAGVIVIIAALITASLVFQNQKTVAEANALLAQNNAKIAEKNASETVAQARVSLARQLAAQATFIQNDKRDLALLLSAEAYTLDNNFETRGSMLSALQCCSDELISFLPGHTDSVWDVAFSPDGKILASGGNDGTIIIWDVATRTQIRRISNSDTTATIYALAFDPNGSILATGDGTGAINFFNTRDWHKMPLELHGHDSSILSLKFSKDGKLLISGGTDGKVIVWDGTRYVPIKTFKGPKSWIWDVAISADNKTIAAVGREKLLRLWDLSQSTTTPGIEVESSSFVSVAFNNNIQSPLLVTGDTSGKVVIWDLRPWQTNHEKPIATKNLPTGPGATTSVWGLALIPGDNFAFVTGRDNGILNRNRISLNEDFSKTSLQPETLGVTGNNLGVFRIDVSPDGKIIAAAGQDGLVSLWNATEMTSVIRHSAKVRNLQVIKDNTLSAVSIDSNGNLQHWNYAKQKIETKLKLNTEEILQSAISSDGTRIITGYKDGTVILWDGTNGKKLSIYSNHSTQITSLAFSADGKHFASSDDNGNVILWSPSTDDKFKLSASFTDPQKSAIQVLLFSQDGSTLIGGGCGSPITFPSPDCSQGAIYVWDVEPNLKLRYEPLPGKAGFVWSMTLNLVNPNELAVGSRDGTVTIWDLKNRTTRLAFRLGKSDITALAFSPDGNLLAVAADGYKVFIYSAITGQVYGQAFREHDGVVIALAFTPDGNSLLSGSTDSTIVIHNTNPADWFLHACQLANRNLTRAEWQQYIGDALPYQAVCENLLIEPELTNTPITP